MKYTTRTIHVLEMDVDEFETVLASVSHTATDCSSACDTELRHKAQRFIREYDKLDIAMHTEETLR